MRAALRLVYQLLCTLEDVKNQRSSPKGNNTLAGGNLAEKQGDS